MPGQNVPREQGILYNYLQQQGAAQQYDQMPPQQRLGLLQNAMRQGKQPSEQDLVILSRLRAMQEAPGGPEMPQLAPQGQEPGILSRLFQFFSGREPVDPLEALKRPGYSGPPSR